MEDAEKKLPPTDFGSLREKFRGAILAESLALGEHTIIVAPEQWRPVAEYLRDDAKCAFNMLCDLTCVDYLPRQPRFEVVAHLTSLSRNARLRIKAPINDGDEIDSLAPVWPAANWLEREVFDLFGIRFRGHPNLKRIVLPEDFEGAPLRRDFSMGKMVIFTDDERPGT